MRGMTRLAAILQPSDSPFLGRVLQDRSNNLHTFGSRVSITWAMSQICAADVPSVIMKAHLDSVLLRQLHQSAELIACLFKFFANIDELIVVVPRLR